MVVSEKPGVRYRLPTNPCDETAQSEADQAFLTKVLLFVADCRDDQFAENTFEGRILFKGLINGNVSGLEGRRRITTYTVDAFKHPNTE